MDDNHEHVSTPFVIDAMSENNRRILAALLSVCITFILTILIFVVGYTIREKNWLNTIQKIGASDGIHEQYDPGAD